MAELRTREDRIAALNVLGQQLNKEYGTTNALVRLGDQVGIPVPSWNLRLPTFDWYLAQCGGVPRGRIIEIYGPESAGKTTITLDILAQVQQAGGLGAFVDAEHALDPNYASKLGVDVDNLFIHQPDNGEQALQTVDHLVDSRAVDIIVVDSVSALVPQAELNGDIGDAHVGLQARLMSQGLRILTGKAARNGVTIIFINQIREKIGVMFGNPETTTGGRALKFYASMRIDVRKTGYINESGAVFQKAGDGVAIGNRMKLKIVKNKVGAPFREAEIDLIYESGIDRYGDMVKFGAKIGVIEKSGAWYSYKGERLGQGISNSGNTFKNNPDLQLKLQGDIFEALEAAKAKAKEKK